jgi:hypothetical protein
LKHVKCQVALNYNVNDEPNQPAETPLPAPVARGLSEWPVNPPAFDLLEAVSSQTERGFADRGIGDADRTTARGKRSRGAKRQSGSAGAVANDAEASGEHDCLQCTGRGSGCVRAGRVGAQQAQDVVAGVSALGRITRATKRMIVIDSPRARPVVQHATHRSPSGTAERESRRVGERLSAGGPRVDDVYAPEPPQCDRVGCPSELGAVLLDAAAASAVGACATRGQSMTIVPLVLRDHDRGETYFMQVPVGITCGNLLEQLGLLNPGDEQLDTSADHSRRATSCATCAST